jgi:hypothetical protein
VLAGAAIFYGDARYALPMVPSLVLFASTAFVWMHDRRYARQVVFAPHSKPDCEDKR